MRSICKGAASLPALYILWLASAVLAAVVLSNVGGTRLSAAVSRSYPKVTYQGDRSAHAEKVIAESPGRFFETLDLRVDFFLEDVSDFVNVFQTADVNAGLRLEASPEGELCLIIGNPKPGDPGHFHPHLLPWRGETGKWHTLRVRLRDGVCRIDFDGKHHDELTHFHRVAASRIVLGNGFNGGRPLIGKAVLVRLNSSTGLAQRRSAAETAFLRAKQVLALLLHMAVVVFLLRRQRRRLLEAAPGLPARAEIQPA